jgi:hypothetical protein
VKSNLDLESGVAVCLVHFQILRADEGNLFIRGLGTEHIAKRYVLEAFSLSDIIIIGTKLC